MARHAHPRRAGLQPRQSNRRVPPREDPAPRPIQSRPGPHQNPPRPGRATRPHHRRHLPDARVGKTRRAHHPRPADRRPGHLPGPGPRNRLDARRPVFDPGQPQIHRVPGVRPPPQRPARPGGQMVLARSAHPPGHRGPRHLGDRPEGRGRAPQRTRRGHAHPGQLAHLPVPVPRPLQNLHAAHVRPAQGAPAPQDPHRAHLLRVPVQPGHPPARRRRPRPPPDRPGPRRLPQSRNLQRPIRLRAGPRPRRTPRAADPVHGHREKAAARPAGRRPGPTAQAHHHHPGQPDARTQRLLRHAR